MAVVTVGLNGVVVVEGVPGTSETDSSEVESWAFQSVSIEEFERSEVAGSEMGERVLSLEAFPEEGTRNVRRGLTLSSFLFLGAFTNGFGLGAETCTVEQGTGLTDPGSAYEKLSHLKSRPTKRYVQLGTRQNPLRQQQQLPPPPPSLPVLESSSCVCLLWIHAIL